MYRLFINTVVIALLVLGVRAQKSYGYPTFDTLMQEVELSSAELFERESIKQAKAGNVTLAVSNIEKYIHSHLQSQNSLSLKH